MRKTRHGDYRTLDRLNDVDYRDLGRVRGKHVSTLKDIDWVIIGGQSASSGEPGKQPEWDWFYQILKQWEEYGCKVYAKPNLTVRPKEFPDLRT